MTAANALAVTEGRATRWSTTASEETVRGDVGGAGGSSPATAPPHGAQRLIAGDPTIAIAIDDLERVVADDP